MSKITIVSVNDSYKATQKGGYNILEVNFRNEQGKVSARKIFSFTAKDVYASLKQANPGDVFEVTEKENDKGYQEFTSAKITTEKAVVGSASTVGAVVPKSNYETSEERATRQTLIVRQSSVSSAISLLTLQGDKKATVDNVLQIARQLEDFVYGRSEAKAASKAVASMRPSSDVSNDLDDEILFDEIPF